MAEEKMTEKVYCYNHPSQDNSLAMAALLNRGNECNPAEMAAMMNGGMGGQWNNPLR